MAILDLIFSALFYICGILLIVSHIKSNVNNDDDIKGSTLTNGLLFIILAILI